MGLFDGEIEKLNLKSKPSADSVQTYCPECYSYLNKEDRDNPNKMTLNRIQFLCLKCGGKLNA